MTKIMLSRPKKQKSEHEQQHEPTLTHDHAASRLVKKAK